MVDFLEIKTKVSSRGVIEIYPTFIIRKSSDLMIRGGDFYAIWNKETGLWSTEEDDVIKMIDQELTNYYNAHKSEFDGRVKISYMSNSETRMIKSWHTYCSEDMRDNFHDLDDRLVFSNEKTTKKDYASKKLPYPLEEGDISAYSKLVSTLYSEKERHKLEWAIGSIINGDSKKIEKFIVMYGAPGTGKGSILKIIAKLFDGYYSVFDAKAIGSATNSFALETLKSNPLVAIQADGDLSRIEDNTRLNTIVSHEVMTVNVKFKSAYSAKFRSFLFMGTNRPVKITDAQSGLLRRLIDVSPSGIKIPTKEYKALMSQIDFELGAIAYHCKQVYEEAPDYYDDYIPINMLGASNDFYNYVLEYYFIFEKENGVTLKLAWERYLQYCNDAKVSFPLPQRLFKEELKNYFDEYKDRTTLEDGTRVRSYYFGFKKDKFEEDKGNKSVSNVKKLVLNRTKSLFDIEYADCPAQYATEDDTPAYKWENVKTKLVELDTRKTHYVRVPENHIVIDFDIQDEQGNKLLDRNLEEAAKWPPTYAELSKSGSGVHLHYIYTGNPNKLSRIYDKNIEIKVFTGKSSLRRKLTKCNDIPIAPISCGLPLKEEKDLVSTEYIVTSKNLRKAIIKNLNKEVHPGTKPSIDFIFKILEDAYSSGVSYDLRDLEKDVYEFALFSTHHSDYCTKLVKQMHFCSKDIEEDKPKEVVNNENDIVFFDFEVFPNLVLVNYKKLGVTGKEQMVRLINPTAQQLVELSKFRLIGFNNRRYDNHIMFGIMVGNTVEQTFELSKQLVAGNKSAFYGKAYELSYMDLYDLAATKQSLKKWEIELGLHHMELGLPWDKPVPKELWPKVSLYCDNDVIATEALYNHLQPDITARKILADIAGMSLNSTTNSLTTRIIFGTDKEPQSRFNYRNMGDVSQIVKTDKIVKDGVSYNLKRFDQEYTVFDKDQRPIFPGYVFDKGVSTYRGEVVGEGGYVYAEPGMYTDVALLDVASMHPHSVIAENLFGDEYTRKFKELVDIRVLIKHKDYDKARTLLDGMLAKYLDDESASKELAAALKIAINSVYGLTSAKFANPFKDPRNDDNIVAKRGALFMINLKHEVQRLGYTVAHIKTDSIKIPNADDFIIEFVKQYGKIYGYTFEHEATYKKLCLVNDAVYICHDGKEWSATGAQFQHPYVFKTLFSREPISFSDLCEAKSVTSALYLDFNEENPDKHHYAFIGKVGLFCPVVEGANGGLLVRESKDKEGNVKYDSATGAKGYRWLESEYVRKNKMEDKIDMSYFNKLVDQAVADISKYGDFEHFVSDDTDKDQAPWEGEYKIKETPKVKQEDKAPWEEKEN